MATETRTAVCNLCEAICGLELTLTDGAVTGVRGNAADPLSRGHICPKGVAIADVLTDPDRLTRPVRRVDSPDGPRWEEIGWDEAFELVADGLSGVMNEHGPDALGDLPRQPQRAQPRLDDPRRRDGQGAAHAQPVQRDLGRPAARTSSSRTCSTDTSSSSRSPTSTAPTTSWSSAPTRWPPTGR